MNERPSKARGPLPDFGPPLRPLSQHDSRKFQAACTSSTVHLLLPTKSSDGHSLALFGLRSRYHYVR